MKRGKGPFNIPRYREQSTRGFRKAYEAAFGTKCNATDDELKAFGRGLENVTCNDFLIHCREYFGDKGVLARGMAVGHDGKVIVQ